MSLGETGDIATTVGKSMKQRHVQYTQIDCHPFADPVEAKLEAKKRKRQVLFAVALMCESQ